MDDKYEDYTEITVKFNKKMKAKRLENSLEYKPLHFKSPFHATIDDEELADALSENVKLKMEIEKLKEELIKFSGLLVDSHYLKAKIRQLEAIKN